MCVPDYPEYEIIFAVGEAADPIIPTIQALQRDFPETQIRLIVGVEQLGACRKTNNLCRLAKEARYELLVMNVSARGGAGALLENHAGLCRTVLVVAAVVGLGSWRMFDR
jgi:hypothetical protein